MGSRDRTRADPPSSCCGGRDALGLNAFRGPPHVPGLPQMPTIMCGQHIHAGGKTETYAWHEWIGKSDPSQIELAESLQKCARVIVRRDESFERIGERRPFARANLVWRLALATRVDWWFLPGDEPAPDPPWYRRALPHPTLGERPFRGRTHGLEIDAIRRGEVVKALGHAPTAPFGAPLCQPFGKTGDERTHVGFDGIELLEQ